MSEQAHKKEHKEHDEKHLEKMTIKELRDIAAEFPHEKAIHDMKKEELIVFIKDAKGIKDEAPIKRKKHVGKIKMTKQEIKTKIRELKALKLQALESKDSKRSCWLTHKISQMKKRSRHFAVA
jgi:hypothetical protein